jgi:hypothetical protein
VITAAHCFGGNAPASSQARLQNGDWTIPPAALAQTHIYLENAVTLPNKADQTRTTTKVVGYRNYGGLNSAPPFVGDIALVELSSPFPDNAVQPAMLAQRGDFNQAVTLAGFGYSNADGGTFDQFNVTWPITTGRPSTVGPVLLRSLGRQRRQGCVLRGRFRRPCLRRALSRLQGRR